MAKNDIVNEILYPGKKYPALRFIAHLYKILGVLMGFVAILFIFFAIIGEFIGSGNSFGWVIIFSSAIIGPLAIISLFALSESIMVFIDMAGNLSKIKEDIGEDLSEIKRRLANKSD